MKDTKQKKDAHAFILTNIIGWVFIFQKLNVYRRRAEYEQRV